MLRRPRVILSLSAASLRLGVQSRRGFARLQRITLDPADWERSWNEGLRPLDQALRDALRRLEIDSAEVDLIFDSPTQVVDVMSVPLSGRAAIKAGELAASENTASDEHTRRYLIAELAASKSEGNASGRSTLLIASERETTLDCLAGWLDRAGLTLAGILPARAITVNEAVHASRNADGRVVMYCGETCTILAASDASAGRLSFVRCIDMGYGLLAEAVTRGAASSGTTIARDRCQELLFNVGVPGRGQIIEPVSGLRAESVLPLMQSVLQRYSVEVKQTLRFSVHEADLSRAKLLVVGAGGHIVGFGTQLSSQLDLDVQCAHADTHAVAADEEGLLSGFAACSGSIDARALTPMSTRDDRFERSLSGSWKCGAAVAALTLAALAGSAVRERDRIRDERTTLDARMSIMAEERNTRRQAEALAAALHDSRSLIAEHMGSTPRWTAVLASVSRAVDDGIALSDIAGAFPIEMRKQPVLTIRGSVRSLPDAAGADPLAAFLARLNADPITAAAHLVSTRAVIAGEEEVGHFQIAIPLMGEMALEPAPRNPVAAGGSGDVAAASEGGEW